MQSHTNFFYNYTNFAIFMQHGAFFAQYCFRWFLPWKSAPSCVACFKAAQYCATHCLWQGNYRICRLRDYHKQSVFAPRSVPSRRFTATRNIFSALSQQYAYAQRCFRWHLSCCSRQPEASHDIAFADILCAKAVPHFVRQCFSHRRPVSYAISCAKLYS